MACVFLGKNEIRENGRGEQIGRHIVGKRHHAPLVEFHPPCRKWLTFSAWGRGKTGPDLSRGDNVMNSRHWSGLAHTETNSVLSGVLQRPQPRVYELFCKVLGLGMRRLENTTCVFLGKNEGASDWPW